MVANHVLASSSASPWHGLQPCPCVLIGISLTWPPAMSLRPHRRLLLLAGWYGYQPCPCSLVFPPSPPCPGLIHAFSSLSLHRALPSSLLTLSFCIKSGCLLTCLTPTYLNWWELVQRSEVGLIIWEGTLVFNTSVMEFSWLRSSWWNRRSCLRILHELRTMEAHWAPSFHLFIFLLSGSWKPTEHKGPASMGKALARHKLY